MARHLIFALATLIPAFVAADDETIPPVEGWIVWASDREDRRHEIYRMRADGTEITRLTDGGAHMAAWSPDGRWIAFRSLEDETLYVMRGDGSSQRQIFPHSPAPGEPNKVPPIWLSDRSGVVSADVDDYYLIDPRTSSQEKLFSIRDFTQIGEDELIVTYISSDRRWVFGYSNVYAKGLKGTNGTFKSGPYVAVAVDLLHKDDIYYIGDGCEPILSETDGTLYHVNRAHFIATMKLDDLKTRESYTKEIEYPYDEWGYLYFPRLSTDGRWLTFAGSQSCHNHTTCDYEIAMHEVGSALGSHKRLTFNTSNDQWPHFHVGELPLTDDEPGSPQNGGCDMTPAAGARQGLPTGFAVPFILGSLFLLMRFLCRRRATDHPKRRL